MAKPMNKKQKFDYLFSESSVTLIPSAPMVDGSVLRHGRSYGPLGLGTDVCAWP